MLIMTKQYFGYSIPAEELGNIKRIGVLCWGLIGDVFFRVPVIEALAQRFPEARITAIVDPAGKAVLENHPDCDEVVVITRNKELPFSYLSGFIRGALRLRRQHFDLFVNLYSGGSSPLLTKLSNARIRLGFDHTSALRKANNLLVKKPDFCQHWTKALGKKLQPLGIGDEKIRRGTTFVIPEQAKLEAEKLLPEQSGLVAFNLGAGVAEKRWPVERFVELARKIHDKFDLKPVVFTNPGMETLSLEFAEQYGKEQCYVMPKLPLATVAALMRRCVAVVTGDTSLMHLAIGIKAPNLTLFTYTRPEIVEPEDCMHVACFVEDPKILNRCDKPVGTTDIPVTTAMDKFNELMSKIQAGKYS